MDTFTAGKESTERRSAAIRRRVVQVASMFGIQGLLLFLAAGRLGWFWGWLYLSLYLAGIAVSAILMFRHNPDAIAERAETAGMRSWDKVVGGMFTASYFFALLIVAGLDARYGWTRSLPLALHLLGMLLFVAGFALFVWAMVTNAHFATVARLRSEGGHAVCSSGPYSRVRHPGYSGAILQSLGAPLLLGSLWALIPGVVSALLLVLRTALEDRMLRGELPGYTEYAGRVRYRLLPPLW